jgi:hypothetical protein
MTNWTDIITAGTAGLGGAGGASAILLRLAKNGIAVLAKDIAADANKPLEDKLDKVQSDLDTKIGGVTHDLNNVKLSLATQFGGNGGGMREAINKLQVDVAELKGHVTATSVPSVIQTVGKHEG